MLVGITGFAGSGKDTAAQVLLERGFERRAFADPMRKGLLGIDPYVFATRSELIAAYKAKYGTNMLMPPIREGGRNLKWLIEEFGWDIAKREIAEVRRLMQAYGTEGGRDIHGQQCWVDAAERTLEEGHSYVFTDVRFPNERDFVQQHLGLVIRICREGVVAANTHSSEQVLDNIDAGILNNGSIEELHAEVLRLVWMHAEVLRLVWKHARPFYSETDLMLQEAQRPIHFGGVALPRIP